MIFGNLFDSKNKANGRRSFLLLPIFFRN